MNLNTSMESHTILKEPSLKPLSLMQENLPPNVLPLEHTPMIPSPITMTGNKESNPISHLLENLSSPKRETNSEIQSSSLKSNVKPHEILERIVEPRVLRVSREDFNALCQVIKEFQEQLVLDNF